MEFTKSSSPSSRQRFCHIRKCGRPVTTITTHCRPRGSRLPRRAGSSKYYAAPDCSCRAVAELHRRAFLLSEVNTAWEAHIVTSKLKASSVCTRAQSLGRQRRPKLNGSPRMLIYPHDISGLGHPRRTIAPAKAFVEVVIINVDLILCLISRSPATEKGKPIARWGCKAKGLGRGSPLPGEVGR